MRPAIDLVRSELAELADVLVEQRKPVQPFGSYVLGPGEPAAELGRQLERAVFLETFGDTPALLADEYAQYETTSIFLVVVDHRRRVPAGMMRVIVPSPAGFKSLDDLPRLWGTPGDEVFARVARSWDRARLWDFATLAVAADYRGEAALGLVTQALVQALTMVGRHWGAHRFVAILDVPVLRMLQWRLGRPFDEFPGITPRSYLGSTSSAPVWGDVASWGARLERVDPVLHDLFFAGRGLEFVVSTPDWDDAAAVVDGVSRRPQSVTDDVGAVSRRTVAGS